jgi:CDGSH-type Zn-finger protein
MTEPTSDEVVITVRKNGSLGIVGKVRLQDHEGREIARINDKPTLALCRCGHSARKPFCDGAHKTIGFIDPPDAPTDATPTP